MRATGMVFGTSVTSARFETTPNVTPASGLEEQKTAVPGWGRAVSRPVVPPHFIAWRTRDALFRTARGGAMRRLCNGSLLAFRPPSPPTWPIGRSERGSEVFFPGSSTPLHSNRGSLHPSFRVLVLLDALAFLDCPYAIKRCNKLSRGSAAFRSTRGPSTPSVGMTEREGRDALRLSGNTHLQREGCRDQGRPQGAAPYRAEPFSCVGAPPGGMMDYARGALPDD